MKYGKEIVITEDSRIKFKPSLITEISMFVGVRKYGKSYAVGVIEEEFRKGNWPFLVIDPMGIHVALREHYTDVVIVGGPYEDLELSDENIYNVVKSGKSVIFDVSEHTIEDQRLICNNVMGCVKELNRTPLNVILEESDIFIPQSGGDKECKAIITWLVRKGRQYGVGMTLICQRLQGRQSIDKDVLSQVDNYFVFKMDSPSDVPGLKKLIPKEEVVKIMRFKPGECYIKSTYHEGIVKIKRRENTHWGFTPELGVEPKVLELKPVRESMMEGLNDKESLFARLKRVLIDG